MEALDTEPYLQLWSILAVQGSLTISVLISLFIIVLLLLMSAFISGSEVAFFSFTSAHHSELKSKGDKTNELILKLLDRPRRLLATILILNNFINVAIVIVSYYFIHDIFTIESLHPLLIFLIDIVAITAMILLLGEIMPKILAANQPMRFATFMSRPLYFLLKLLYPFSSVLVHSTNFVDRRIAKRKENISMDELSEALEITTSNETPEEELKMLEGIIRFGDTEVREIMKSRVDVVALDSEEQFDKVIATVMDCGYSRIPVYEESLDNIKGILYVKDLLPYLEEREDFKWNKLLRSAFFVPESKKINDLLQEIRDKKIHMAIVVDEYGGTAGIVTLEDIIEEIIGEISDEFDSSRDEVDYRKLNERTYSFEGKTSINDFCKIVNIEDNAFDDIKGDFDSLAGLLLEHFGDLPEKDEVFEYNNMIFKVVSVDHKRIQKIKVIIKNPDQ